MHDAQLHFGLRKDTFNRFGKAFQPINAGDEDVSTRDSSVPLPLAAELGAFRLRDPKPQHFFQAIDRDPNRQIDRLF